MPGINTIEFTGELPKPHYTITLPEGYKVNTDAINSSYEDLTQTCARQVALIKKLVDEIAALKAGSVSTRRSILARDTEFNGRSNRVARPTGGY